MSTVHEHKHDLTHEETAYPAANKADSEAYVDTYVEGTEAERLLVRKIDRHMLPMLWAMYM